MTRGAARVNDPREAEWVTQDQAAVVTGVPLSSIDWWARSGRIETRSERPTVNRASVVAYAAERRQYRAALAAKREAKSSLPKRRSPQPAGTITTDEAAEILGLKRSSTLDAARRAGLTLIHWRRLVLLDRAEVEALAAERRRWISSITVAAATGISVSVVRRAAVAGLIETRADARTRTARLDRESACAWAANEVERRRAAAAARLVSQQRPDSGPPQDGNSWMSVRSASVLLGLTEYWTARLVEREKLPATRHNGRYWLQPAHVFSALAGREHRAKAG